MLHVICTRLPSGHLSVRVGHSSRRSEEIIKTLESRLSMRLILFFILLLLLLLLLLSLLSSSSFYYYHHHHHHYHHHHSPISILFCVLPLQEVALRQSLPSFSVLCCPCLYRSLLSHTVISPTTFWSSD